VSEQRDPFDPPRLGGLIVRNPVAPAAWTPASLPGLLTWYDASNAGSITQSGGLVSQLNDLSGHGYHATQPTGANQPTTGSVTLNGNNTLTFAFNSAIYLTTSVPDTAQPFTAYAVISGASGESTLLQFGGGQLHVGGTTWFYLGSAISGSAPGAVAQNLRAIANGASSSVVINGTTYASGDVSTGSTGSPLLLGKSGSYGFGGNLAELVIQAAVGSAGDLTSWSTYATAKWGTP